MLNGRYTRLRPLEERDLDYYSACMSDPDLATVVLGDTALSEKELIAKLRQNQRDLLFTIEALSREPIGFCFLRNIHPVHRFAELEQFFIGDEKERCHGYGEDAIRALIGHCFAELGLNRIWLITYAYNFAAIRFYKKCGFSKEGVLRQIQFAGGTYHDGVMMAVLKQNWVPPHERY